MEGTHGVFGRLHMGLSGLFSLLSLWAMNDLIGGLHGLANGNWAIIKRVGTHDHHER